MAARTFPTYTSPLDAYTSDSTRSLMYLEKTTFSGAVFNNTIATIRANVAASATTSGFACGLVIRDEIGASATVPMWHSLYMYHCSESTLTDCETAFIRFEDNSASANMGMYSILEYAGKNSTTVGTEVFVYTTSGQAPWFRKTGTPGDQAGWFKCSLGGTTKYIALYSSVT
jgi:hypothetical protein